MPVRKHKVRKIRSSKVFDTELDLLETRTRSRRWAFLEDMAPGDIRHIPTEECFAPNLNAAIQRISSHHMNEDGTPIYKWKVRKGDWFCRSRGYLVIKLPADYPWVWKDFIEASREERIKMRKAVRTSWKDSQL